MNQSGKTTERPLLRGIQGGRGIAASLIVLLHLSMFSQNTFGRPLLGNALSWCYAGVDFFFVLSGFLIATIHWDDLGQPSRLGAYVYKRVARIYPFYWVALTAFLLLRTFAPTLAAFSPTDVVENYLLWPIPSQYVMSVAWSLSYEVLFYAAFAVGILSRRSLGWIGVLWLLGFATALATGFRSPFFSPLVIEFQLGVLTAWAMRRFSLGRPGLVGVSAVAGLVIWAVLDVQVVAQDIRDFFRLGYAVLACAIVWSVVEAERAKRLHVPGWLVALGDASFSIYLTHWVFLSGLEKLNLRLHFNSWPRIPTLCLVGLAVVAGGWIVHRAVEAPLLGWLRRRRRPATADGASA